MEEEKKKTEQTKSTILRLIELLEANGYWVWSITKSYDLTGLITLSIRSDRKG